MRLLLVVNPAAAGGKTLRHLPAVVAALEGAGHDTVVAHTRDIAHAEELGRRAAAEAQVAVAFGGDGLVGRVAGAVAAAGGTLAVLPGGRGNDFARVLGVPRDPATAAAGLASARLARLDLGEVDGTSFLGIASLGFDSVVQQIAAQTRLPLGQLVYLYATLRAVVRWQPATFRVTLDGAAHSVTGWSVAVANSGVYGGGMRLAPGADLSDGQLDVVTTARTGRLKLLRVLPKVFAGTHLREPSVRVARAARIGIEADRPFTVYADGDPVGELPCAVRVHPGALPILVPPTWPGPTTGFDPTAPPTAPG